MLDQVVPVSVRMGEHRIGICGNFYTWTSYDNLPNHRLLGLFQKLRKISKLVMVPPQTWTAHPSLAYAPCDTGSGQDFRRGDDDFQLPLCGDFRCRRLGPANDPSGDHDPRRNLCANPGQRTAPHNGFRNYHSQIGMSYTALPSLQCRPTTPRMTNTRDTALITVIGSLKRKTPAMEITAVPAPAQMA